MELTFADESCDTPLVLGIERNRTNAGEIARRRLLFSRFVRRKTTIWINMEHCRFRICDRRDAEHNYEVQEQLKSRAHKECMAEIGRYVERALL